MPYNNPDSLFPFADPTDRKVVASFRKRLAEEEASLADYYATKGRPGYYFGRGFVSQTKAVISRLKRWLKSEAGAG